MDFRQKGQAPAEAQGSVGHHHNHDDDDYHDDGGENYEDNDDEDDDDDLSSRLHLFSRGLEAGLVQCQ